ncbi:hypothetical protein IGI04_040112, partial [Brassica rapa subsp. trilocularis]
IVVNASSWKTAQRDLKHDSRPILRFLNQKPVNHNTVYAWSTKKDKCQVSSSRKTTQRDLKHDSRPILRFLNEKKDKCQASADKYGSFEDNCEDREKWNISILCYDDLRAEEHFSVFVISSCDSIRFSRLRVARTRNLADSSRAQAYTLLYPGPLGN